MDSKISELGQQNVSITVKPVYNWLGYNELPLITQYIVCTDRIDFLIKWSVITKTRFLGTLLAAATYSLQTGLTAYCFNWREEKIFAFISVIDAMGKFPSGFLEGTVTNLGDFDECIDIDVPFEDEMSFRGKYCLFYMTPELPPKPTIIKHSDQVFNLSGTQAEGTFFEYISNSSSGVYSVKHFRIGICVPSICRNEEIQQIGYQCN